jgi:hypothetical protein
LKRDRPPALRGVLAHGAHLQGQSLLVVRGHPRIQSMGESSDSLRSCLSNHLR